MFGNRSLGGGIYGDVLTCVIRAVLVRAIPVGGHVQYPQGVGVWHFAVQRCVSLSYSKFMHLQH